MLRYDDSEVKNDNQMDELLDTLDDLVSLVDELEQTVIRSEETINCNNEPAKKDRFIEPRDIKEFEAYLKEYPDKRESLITAFFESDQFATYVPNEKVLLDNLPFIENCVVNILKNSDKNSDKYLTLLKIIDFLKGSDSLVYSQINKIELAYDMINCLMNPFKIQQGASNLCGPATLLMLYLNDDPVNCIENFISLVLGKKSEHKLKLKPANYSKEKDSSFSAIYLSALKNASNNMGYSNSFNNCFSKKIEKFQGITEPRLICEWLKNCNFASIVEATFIQSSNDTESLLATFANAYDKDHKVYDSREDNLKAACKFLAEGGNLVLLMKCGKSEALKGIVAQQSSSFLTLEGSHYIIAKQLIYDEENKVVFLNAWSYGKETEIKIKLEEFLSFYRGYIGASYKPLRTSQNIMQDSSSSQAISNKNTTIPKPWF